jgi:cell division protein FtsW
MHVAKHAPDFAGRMLALGFTLSIAIEAIFNMGVATGLLPTKGIPLPFMSFGGSSLLANALGVGLVLSVSRFSVLPLQEQSLLNGETR